MAMSKIDRINKEIQKTREKITEYQNKLRGLEAQKTEAENLEIVQLVRAMRMTPQELSAMLSGGTMRNTGATPLSMTEDALRNRATSTTTRTPLQNGTTGAKATYRKNTRL